MLTGGTDAKQVPFTDHYKTLGIDHGADDNEIAKIIRAKVKELHPDRNPDDPHAAEHLRKVLAAKEILTDRENRNTYDRLYSAPTLLKWGMGKSESKVISSGTHQTVGKRGSVDRRLDGIDHLMGEIDEIETETDAELKIVKHKYTIIASVIAAVIGFFVAGPAGMILFALVGAIVGYYLGNKI